MDTDLGLIVKRKLSAHVQQRMAIAPNDKQSNDLPKVEDSATLVSDDISTTCDDGGRPRKKKTPSGNSVDEPATFATPNTTGSFNAGPLSLSNSILGEVLNEKKLALLKSPEVIQFLQDQHRKSTKRH